MARCTNGPRAVVQADVQGALLSDPTDQQFRRCEAHSVPARSGPYILPLGNRIAFEGLTPGKHNIEVMLDNNRRPLGPKVELEITRP